MRHLNFLQILLLVTLCSCDFCREDDPTTLPSETQTGANTFGCYVNGELFVQGRPIYLGEPRLYTVYSIDKKQLSMSADNHLMDMSLTFYYFIDSVNTNYKIEDFFHNGQLNVTLLYDVNFAVFSCNNNHYFNCINSRDLVITKLDTENKIVSGRFNFILISETDITDTIKITDGRFDSKLHLNQ